MVKPLPPFVKEKVKVPVFVKDEEDERENVFNNPNYHRVHYSPTCYKPAPNVYIRNEVPDISLYLKFAQPVIGGMTHSFAPVISRGNLIHFICVDEKGNVINEYKGIYHGKNEMHLLGRQKTNVINTNAGMLKNDIVKYIRHGVFVFRVINSNTK